MRHPFLDTLRPMTIGEQKWVALDGLPAVTVRREEQAVYALWLEDTVIRVEAKTRTLAMFAARAVLEGNHAYHNATVTGYDLDTYAEQIDPYRWIPRHVLEKRIEHENREHAEYEKARAALGDEKLRDIDQAQRERRKERRAERQCLEAERGEQLVLFPENPPKWTSTPDHETLNIQRKDAA